MESALLYDRLQFAVTVTFHYLFPQLTMGLALLLLYLRTRALVTGDYHYQEVARFWTKIFALSFAFGVVTGIRWNSSSARTGPSSPTSPAG